MVVLLHWVGNLCFSKFKRLPHNLIQHMPACAAVETGGGVASSACPNADAHQ
jgi:hypothetical protein